MIINTDLTLYNQIRGPDGPTWQRSYIHGVNWQDTKKVAVGEHGLVNADVTNIFIPFNSAKGYLKPKAFQSEQNKQNHFTLGNGDIVVRGIIDFELTGEKDANEKALQRQYDDVRTVVSVETCDNGNADMQHWEVMAK